MGEKCDVCGWKMGEKQWVWVRSTQHVWVKSTQCIMMRRWMHLFMEQNERCRWLVGWYVLSKMSLDRFAIFQENTVCVTVSVYFQHFFFFSLPIPKPPLFLHRWTSDSIAHLVEEYPSLSYVTSALEKNNGIVKHSVLVGTSQSEKWDFLESEFLCL